MKPVTTMVRRGALLGLALLLCAGSASAQLYKWVDANGKTHFSDRPPPPGARPAALKGKVGTSTANMPYALATAMRNFPVTMYTTKPCSACDLGRSYLKTRGIPFSEITVSTAEDEAKMRAAGGDGNMPYFIVGNAKESGYLQSKWESMLDGARYPATNVLPLSYQHPAATAAAPVAPKAAQAATAEQEEPGRSDAAKPDSNAPPGFRF